MSIQLLSLLAVAQSNFQWNSSPPPSARAPKLTPLQIHSPLRETTAGPLGQDLTSARSLSAGAQLGAQARERQAAAGNRA